MTTKYEVSFKFSQDELAHHLMPRKGVIVTLVVENENENGKKEITDFISFYNLPSSILKCKDVQHDYKNLNIAYLYYYSTTKNDLKELVSYALVYAKDKTVRNKEDDDTEFDVFNCLNLMENSKFIRELKFGAGDGSLHYYMFNYLLKHPGYMGADKICTVLV